MKIKDLLEKEYNVYHGTPAHKEVLDKGFSYDFIGKGEDVYGYGFYFTDNENAAHQYTKKTGKVIKAKVSLKNPLIYNNASSLQNNSQPELQRLRRDQVYRIIIRAPDIHDENGPLSNFGDMRSKGFQKVIASCLDKFTENGFFTLMNDFYRDKPKEFLKAYHEVTKKDGIIVNFDNGTKFIIAWFPEQIQIQKNLHEAQPATKRKSLGYFGVNTQMFLNKWVYGNPSALRMITPAIKQDLERTIDYPEYRLVRGIKIGASEEYKFKDIFGLDLSEIKKGAIVNIKYNTPTSWTTSVEVSKDFANVRFSSLDKQHFSDDELDELGYDKDEVLGYGIRVIAIIKKENIIADLRSIPEFEEKGENEIIVAAGQYRAKIVSFKEYKL